MAKYYRLSVEELFNKYVSENAETFKTDGKLLHCKVCKQSLSLGTKSAINRHLRTQKHKLNFAQSTGKASDDNIANKHLAKRKECTLIWEKNEDFCRTCMKQFSKAKEKDFKQNITEIPAGFQDNTTIMELLEIIQPQIKVEIKNKFPSLICSDCVQKLLVSYEFIKMYQNVDKKLHTMLKELDIENCNNKSDDYSQSQPLEEIEVPVDFETNKSHLGIEQINICDLKQEQDEENNYWQKLKDDPIQELSNSAENNESKKLSNTYSDASNETWLPDKNCASQKENNFDDVTKFDIRKCSNNSDDEPQLQLLEEIEVTGNFETNKHNIEIDKTNDVLEEEQNEKNNRWPQQKDVDILEMSNGPENNESYNFSNPYSDDSDDDWLPDKNSPSACKKENDTDDCFFQPEKNDDGTLTCQLCETDLNGVVLWREHMRQHHIKEKTKTAYKKSKSRKKEKQKQAKKSRKILPKKSRVYQCEYCEKSFPKYLFLRRHRREHTEPHLCMTCGKSFLQLSSFNTHLLRHKGEKTYQCPKCPKSFVCASGLYNHEHTHSTHRPYVCDTCGSAFQTPYWLKYHKRIHLGIKKYKCDYCDMRFITGDSQQRHMRTHTGEKPYRCKYCERGFAQSNDCVKHLRQHLGENVYQCDLCPMGYPLLRQLRVHFVSHKNDDEETRARNLKARMDAEKDLQMKLGYKDSSA